jgi:DNA-binding response OmpR family regulator
VTSAVVVIEPDRQLRDAICLHLSLAGYPCAAYAGPERTAVRTNGDNVLLAVVNLQSVRHAAVPIGGLGAGIPKLVVSEPGAREEAIAALEGWADDYLMVPFEMRELVARAQALIRRKLMLDGLEAGAGRGRRRITYDGFVLDPARRRVEVDGRRLTLTEKEFRFLEMLAARPGVVFPRDVLLATFASAPAMPRSVDAIVVGIRRQLRLASPRWAIGTVRGVGYQFRRVT